MTGIVTGFNEARRFGFIREDGAPEDAEKLFVHASQIVNATSLPIGAEVSYLVVRSDRHGGRQAARVELMVLGGGHPVRVTRRKRKQWEEEKEEQVVPIRKAS